MNALIKPAYRIVNWKRFSAYQWLEQYGAWLSSGKPLPDLNYPQPLAKAIERAKEKKPKNKPAPITVEITDTEALEVQRILMSMRHDSDIEVREWGSVLLDRFDRKYSFREIADNRGWSVIRVQQAEKQGIAYFSGCIKNA